MKLVTYNVRDCVAKEAIINSLTRIVQTEHPDYICLQEYAPTKEIEELLLKHNYNLISVEYKRHKELLLAYVGGQKEKRAWVLPLKAYGLTGPLVGQEFKGLVAVLFETGEVDRIIINAHLPVMSRIKKLQRLTELLEDYLIDLKAEIYLCGDFNVTPDIYRYLERRLGKLGFRPVCPRVASTTLIGGTEKEKFFKLRQVLSGVTRHIHIKTDWVFVNLEDLQTYKVEAKVISTAQGSDHLPLLVTLQR